jgi:hypothetical protein
MQARFIDRGSSMGLQKPSKTEKMIAPCGGSHIDFAL